MSRAIEICKVEAYARKESVGGKFGCVVIVRKLDKYGIEQKTADTLLCKESMGVFDSQDAAFLAGYNFVQNRAKDRALTVAHCSSNKFRKDYRIWA